MSVTFYDICPHYVPGFRRDLGFLHPTACDTTVVYMTAQCTFLAFLRTSSQDLAGVVIFTKEGLGLSPQLSSAIIFSPKYTNPERST